MALTQRLEFRQSQALVMTPQLMQAIKLLQERPEGPEGPQAGENAPNTLADAPGEAPENEWAKPDVNGSAAIEDSFDTPIENVFPDAGEAPQRPAQAEPAAYSEWAGVRKHVLDRGIE